MLGPILLKLNAAATRLRAARQHGAGRTAKRAARCKQVENWPADLHTDAGTLTTHKTYEGKDYLVWHTQPPGGAAATQYLVDSTGTPLFLVDPGINGTHKSCRRQARA